MDSFDYRILEAIQLNSRVSLETLAHNIGLSSSAVQRRIRKLKADGVIAAEQAILNPQKIPGYLTAIVDIELVSGGEKVLDAFIRKMDQHPNVQQVFYVAGDADFVVILVAKDMEDFDALTRTLFMSKNIQKFTSKIVIKTPKASLKVPLG